MALTIPDSMRSQIRDPFSDGEGRERVLRKRSLSRAMLEDSARVADLRAVVGVVAHARTEIRRWFFSFWRRVGEERWDGVLSFTGSCGRARTVLFGCLPSLS